MNGSEKSAWRRSRLEGGIVEEAWVEGQHGGEIAKEQKSDESGSEEAYEQMERKGKEAN